MLLKSFYDLRFGVSPGAARKDAHHIYGTLDEIRSALETEFDESINVWLLFDYGRSVELALDVYQRGVLERSIDLHPFVTVRIDGYPGITFRGPGKPTGYAAGASDPEKVRMTLADGLFEGTFNGVIEVVVDWDRITVPPLTGEIAEWDDYVLLGEGPPDDDLDALAELDEDDLESELVDRGWVEYGDHDFDA